MVRDPTSSRTLLAPQSFFKVMVGDFFDKLLIPPAYAKNIEGFLPRGITLTTRDGQKEQVMMSEIKNNLYFKAGWSNFAKDKSINLGDFLVFHIVGEFEFNVTIYRSKTGCEDMHFGKNDMNVIDIDSDDPTSDMEIDKFERKRAIKVPNAMQQRERRAVEAADKFVSGHPYFKVAMAYAYVNSSYLYVPSSFVKEYLTRQSQNVMLRTSKKSSWTVKLSVVGNCRCRITSGWSEFVRDNDLHKGDVCVFEMIKRFEVVVLKVSIFRCTLN